MQRTVSATVDSDVAAMLDVCDILVQFHRELQQLRARQRQESETRVETAEATSNSTVNAPKRADDGENGSGASAQQEYSSI